jgi:hypothetical protein
VRNPRTQARIRRDVIWQIAAPLGLFSSLMLVLAWWVASPAGANTRSALADVSLIFLIIPTMIAGLVLLALMGGAGFVLWRYALSELPYLFKRAQDIAALAAEQVKQASKRAAEVVLSAQSFAAGASKTADNVRTIFTPNGRSK